MGTKPPKPTVIGQALRFAAAKHRGQRRKFNDEPYVAHPIRVARRVLEFKDTSNPDLLAAAALLHDTVEDTDTSLSEIAELFGHPVAAIVSELTSDDNEVERMGKAEYLAREMLEMSDYALVEKLADRLDNTSDFDSAPKDFVQRYSEETQHIIDRLLRERDLTATQLRLVQEIIKNLRDVR